MVSTKQFEPDYCVSPGEILLMHLEAEGMSQAELALRTGLTPKTINKIIQTGAPISYETAIKLEHVLGYPASYWNDLEKYYRERLAKQEEEKRLKEDYTWVKQFPLKEMRDFYGLEIDFRDSVKTTRNVLNFLGIASSSCGDEKLKVAACFRQSNTKNYSQYALYAWLREGELRVKQTLPPTPYDQSGFRKALNEIKGLTRVSDLNKSYSELKKICSEVGVAVVFVRDLPKIGTNGATRWIDGHPVIQLSLRLRTNDQIWFTFFHEAAHVLEGHGKKHICVNLPESEDADERFANAFAANFLIPKEKLDCFLRKYPRQEALLMAIPGFAEDLGIAPAIVLGRLQHEERIPFSRGHKYKISYSWTD